MKLKTCKSAAKRVKVKKNYIARKQAYTGHLMRRKTTKQLRTLSQPAKIHKSNEAAFFALLPNG
jgi:large subunit ribosomal protein L35